MSILSISEVCGQMTCKVVWRAIGWCAMIMCSIWSTFSWCVNRRSCATHLAVRTNRTVRQFGVMFMPYGYRAARCGVRSDQVRSAQRKPSHIRSNRNHRQVPLLENVFKLYDKMLAQRIKTRVKPHFRSWQTAGVQGADETAWVLNELVRQRARQGNGKHPFVLFVYYN